MISLIPLQILLQNLVRIIFVGRRDVQTDAEIDMYGYLNQAWVLEALGVPVNFSSFSYAVGMAFDATTDFYRAGSSEAVSYLLESGVKVHMVYGDRDFACGLISGEAASLAIEYSGTENFKNAGYAPIISAKGIGGFVRQYGNFSFSRVFQAGHEGKRPCSSLTTKDLNVP